MIDRRTLLRTATALPMLAALQGCGKVTEAVNLASDPNVAKVIQYGQSIAAALDGIVPLLPSSATVDNIVAGVHTAEQVLSTVSTVGAAASPFSAIAGSIPQVAQLIAGLTGTTISPSVQAWIAAGSALVQIAMPLLGLALAPAPTALAAPIGEAQALATLAALAPHR